MNKNELFEQIAENFAILESENEGGRNPDLRSTVGSG